MNSHLCFSKSTRFTIKASEQDYTNPTMAVQIKNSNNNNNNYYNYNS
jgi:hypothetical protein